MLTVGDGHFRTGTRGWLPLVYCNIKRGRRSVRHAPESALVYIRHQGTFGRRGHMGRKRCIGRDGSAIESGIGVGLVMRRWMSLRLFLLGSQT